MDDVARVASALPEVTEGLSYRYRTWKVGKTSFAWDRPLSKADLKRLGDEPAPTGPLLAVRTDDLHDKEAVLQARPDVCFTIAHFDRYPAVLVRLNDCDLDSLTELITAAWLAAAPDALAREFVARTRDAP